MKRLWRNPATRAGLVVLVLTALPGMASAAHCPADLQGDEAVGFPDLLILQSCWGPTTNPCAGADFNGDKDVECFDLEYLLGNWGACPCLGDLDGDGEVAMSDLLTLLNDWEHDCRFDLTQNGIVDQSDIDALLCLWGTSGPLGDFDGDGDVGTSDLLLLEVAFGEDCGADLDHDGVVGQGDLDMLLAAWGACG